MALIALSLLLPASPGAAQSTIRDDEIEDLLTAYAAPIFRAAGLGGQNIRIHIVRDLAFNAFVVNAQTMFINAGTLMLAKRPDQVIAVVAHETGHIAGSDLTGIQRANARARSATLMCRLLGIAAVAGGAIAGVGAEVGQAGMGVALGCQGLAVRSILEFRRIEESAADQAAVQYLRATGHSVCGMLDTFAVFVDQQRSFRQFIDPYLQSHPLPRERIAQLRNEARGIDCANRKAPPDLQLRHDLMRAKLTAFLKPRRDVLNIYPQRDQSLPAKYARAIAANYGGGGVDAFLPLGNELIAADPANPFFHEIKGQFLFESARPAKAIGPLRTAIKLAKQQGRRSALMTVLLARALVAADPKRHATEVIRLLEPILDLDESQYTAQLAIANAYYKVKRPMDADMAHAHYLLYRPKRNREELRKDLKSAKEFADRVLRGAPTGLAVWLKADDFLNRLNKKR